MAFLRYVGLPWSIVLVTHFAQDSRLLCVCWQFSFPECSSQWGKTEPTFQQVHISYQLLSGLWSDFLCVQVLKLSDFISKTSTTMPSGAKDAQSINHLKFPQQHPYTYKSFCENGFFGNTETVGTWALLRHSQAAYSPTYPPARPGHVVFSEELSMVRPCTSSGRGSYSPCILIQ